MSGPTRIGWIGGLPGPEGVATPAGDALDARMAEEGLAEGPELRLMAARLYPELYRPGVRSHARKTYRERVKRRWASPVGHVAWFVRGGTPLMVVANWLAHGWQSQDPVEAAIVRALRRLYVGETGRARKSAYRHRAVPLASLAFVLWYCALESRQRGYQGFVQGLTRGMLAELSAHRPGDVAMHPDTISRHLAELRRVLGGLLDFQQIPGEEAKAHGLPRALHLLDDGSTATWSANIYRWRGASYLRLSGSPDPSDPGSGYLPPEKTQKKESPQTATIDPGPLGPLTTGPPSTAPPDRVATGHEGSKSSSVPPSHAGGALPTPGSAEWRQRLAELEHRDGRGEVLAAETFLALLRRLADEGRK